MDKLWDTTFMDTDDLDLDDLEDDVLYFGDYFDEDDPLFNGFDPDEDPLEDNIEDYLESLRDD